MKGERRLAQVGSDAVVVRKRGRRGRVAALVGAWLGLVVWAAASYAPLDQLGVELYRPYFLPCATVLSLWLPLSRAIDWVRTVAESGSYPLLAVGSVLAGGGRMRCLSSVLGRQCSDPCLISEREQLLRCGKRF